MFENLILFLKIIVYLLTVCRNVSAQYGKFDCEKLIDKSSTTVCKLFSNENSILPVEDIADDTESLIIITLRNGSLAITRADLFQNFEKLKNLEIQLSRSLHISENLLNSVSIPCLQNLLFDIPTLKRLSIKYNQFNDKSYSWKLPANLERLYLTNGVIEFDLRNSSGLLLMRLNRNKLSKIPWSHDSSPALKILDLRNNPLNDFSVDDIADLCHLKYYAMDTSQISICECNKLQQWIFKSSEWANFTFGGSLNCTDNIESNSTCTLEEALSRRSNRCSNWWDDNKKWILLAAGEGGGVVGLFVAFSVACCFGWCVICWFFVGWCFCWNRVHPENTQKRNTQPTQKTSNIK